MLEIVTAVLSKAGNVALQTVSLLTECSGPVNHITRAGLSSSDKDIHAHHNVLVPVHVFSLQRRRKCQPARLRVNVEGKRGWKNVQKIKCVWQVLQHFPKPSKGSNALV